MGNFYSLSFFSVFDKFAIMRKSYLYNQKVIIFKGSDKTDKTS